MLREIRELGFAYAELSHNTRLGLVPGITEAVDAGEIRISSVHNFCPLPLGVNYAAPNLYQFSAERPRERDLAFRYTVKTLEFAARLKVPVVVLHLGRIDMKDHTRKLAAMVAHGQRDSPKYAKLCTRLVEKRAAQKQPYVDRVYEVLRRLIPEAESRGITLGVENREGLEELPLEGDLGMLFKEFPGPTLGYWHDTGHAQIKENLGLLPHAFHVEAWRDRLAGFHLHDVQFPAFDHCAPGTGTVDWAALKPWVKPEHIKVFEFSPALTVAELRNGVEHIKQLWGPE